MSTRTVNTTRKDQAARLLMWSLLLAIAAVAFYTSFEAISGYAVRVGTFPAARGWCAPVLVDAVTVTGGLLVLTMSAADRPTGYGWTLVAGASLVSVALNVAHAPHRLSAQLVAVLAPAALLVSLEALMLVVREQPPARPAPPERSSEQRGPTEGAPLRVEGAQPTRASEQQGALASTHASAEGQGATKSRAVVRALLTADPGVRVERVMAEAGVSKGRAYELLRQERAARNGHDGERQ